jgi:hypothetical protein
MRNSRFYYILILSVILLGSFLFRDNLYDFYSWFSLGLPEAKGIVSDLIKRTEVSISLPPPLRISDQAPEAFLTKSGIIEWTNTQRSNFGLPKLSESSALDSSAEIKVNDMLDKQYFAHESLSGVGVGDLADSVGYEFIAIAENLALGGFKDDEALVQGWMDSPGHRANILNPSYQEIGVAVVKGIYEGQTTWLAVQHFATPLSVCDKPDLSLKINIDSKREELGDIEKILSDLKKEIRIFRPKRGSAYNKLIKEYNDLFAQYDQLAQEVEILINTYNIQVTDFNQCVKGSI